ncbi:uncharacterized protein AMSG_05656 [Thecamonas trahens ATCC 50062]|uniref:ER-bound oxygenase mpaB/mpaB'/Rubber oxygenase catalytic domain-containing protein n=1 Tax=Thecamonas trahens ATCC 50062 TaxID=461836 RepID=A0A0L0DBL0_THETB|nr:hypothetical protein AMSG_05656 [Thecamonas trahens ATCC 50062]KNC49615.1 hypothetical protein AMSG_05656 [Thecamonas trahens ATCC 50062]|eukprot:XP_013757722.1 hypothetical protein AMSG_05656 [Thecamonas trahens ATCC 50062]
MERVRHVWALAPLVPGVAPHLAASCGLWWTIWTALACVTGIESWRATVAWGVLAGGVYWLLVLAVGVGPWIASRARVRHGGVIPALSPQPEHAIPPPERVAAALQTGDPPADALVAHFPALVAALMRSEEPVVTAAALAEAEYVDAEAAEALHALAAPGLGLPAWATPEMLHAGQEVYIVNAGFQGLGLLVSLLESFLFPEDAAVLAATGALTGPLDRAAKRALDTGSFIQDLMYAKIDGKRPSRAADAALRIRLVHGRARRMVARSAAWQERGDVPINQATSAATLVLFCQVAVESSATMGAWMPQTDKDALWTFWRYVGHLMGIDADLVPPSYAGGLAGRCSGMYVGRLAPDMSSRALVARTLDAMVGIDELPFDPVVVDS